MRGQIYKALSGFYYVHTGDQLYQTRARGNFRQKKSSPLVGDWVEFESTNDKEGMILNIEPRRNVLKRPNVANVDQVIIVSSLVEPQFSSLLLDRFIVQAEQLQVRILLYWTKWDLVDDNDRETILKEKEQYERLGYPVFLGEKGQVPPALLPYFKDQLTVVMGQSGVGKSTLLNALNPELQLETNDISEALGRGRHTTRHIELWPLHQGLIVDTPGFSSLEFDTLTVPGLADDFVEFRQWRSQCKFRECTHDHEPKCRVKEAVDAGEISNERYQHYLMLKEEIQNRKPNYR